MSMLLLVDGSNIMFRSFYGIRPFTTKSGLHTNAVYGMITTLSARIEALRPDYVAVAFDLPEPTFRHLRFADYKGTRQKMPPELAEQLPFVRRAADALGAHVADLPGYEADDLLGTLARLGEAADLDVRILTGDRDSLQLITDKTRLCFITGKETVDYGRDEFFRDYGTEPPRLVDLKALMGDSSDNIPGVPGVGEKTAKKLLAEAGSLDGIYKNLPSLTISDKLREKLSAGRDSAYMSYDLATIRRDAPTEVTLSDLEYKGPDRDSLAALFSELEFYKLAERFGITTQAAAPSAAAAREPLPEAAVLDGEAASRIIAAAEGGDTPALALFGGDAFILSGGAVYRAAPSDGALRSILEKTSIICHDYKSLCALFSPDVRLACAFDTMLAAYVLRPGDTSYALSRVSMTYLGENAEPETGEAAVSLISRLASAMKAEFARVDAEAEAAGERPASSVLYDIELPLVPVLAGMEAVGVGIDTDGVRRYAAMLAESESALAEQIYMLAGHTFNINSPKQLGEVLFVELGLPAGKKNHRGYSTDAETLEALRDYEIVDRVLAHRQISKLRSTYGDALADAADARGRIHTSFRQTVTATGRLSSTDPNLQNIPVRTELGRELRRFFVAQEGRVLVDADYSQIELRLLANISGDPVMSAAFLRGADIHASTAAEVFGVPEEAVTRELRSRAKAVNFGIVYGIGDYSLSRDIGTTRKTAAKYIEDYLSTYKGVDKYLKDTVARARERGYVATMYGRRRYIPEITASNKMTRAFGERVAMNSPIQGAAADIIKLAMIGVARALRDSGLDAHLILQIHDELIVECRTEDADAVSEILRKEMQSAASLPVPLTVEVSRGASWYDCK